MTTKTVIKSEVQAAVATAPTMIPLDKLVLSEANVRKSSGETAIKELRLVSVEVCSPVTRLAAHRPFVRKVG